MLLRTGEPPRPPRPAVSITRTLEGGVPHQLLDTACTPGWEEQDSRLWAEATPRVWVPGLAHLVRGIGHKPGVQHGLVCVRLGRFQLQDFVLPRRQQGSQGGLADSALGWGKDGQWPPLSASCCQTPPGSPVQSGEVCT